MVLPAGNVDKSLDTRRDDPLVSSYTPRNDVDKYNWSLYDPEAMDGLPISIQLVGQRLEEEKVLAAAKVVEAVLRASDAK